MHPRLRAALLVAMLLLAGCIGSLSTDTASTTTDGRIPATTDTTQTTVESTDEALPPGVTEDGVSTASALLAAHASALKETSYGFEYRSITEVDGGTNATATQRGTVSAGFASFELRSVHGDANRYRSTLWANDSVLLTKRTADGTTWYDERTRNERLEAELDSAVTKTETLSVLLRSGTFEIAGTDRSAGRTLTTLRATEPAGGTRYENATDFDATLVVDSSGRVHEFHRTVVTETSILRQDFELSVLDAATVERPEWAGNALATTTANIDVDSTTDAIRFEHAGGEDLPAGSTVRIDHDGDAHTLELAAPLGTGESVYIYYPGDGGAPVLVADEPTDARAERIDGEYSITVLDPNGNAVLSMGFSVGYAESSGDSS